MANTIKKLGMRMLTTQERNAKYLPWYAGRAWTARRDAIARRIAKRIEVVRKNKAVRMAELSR